MPATLEVEDRPDGVRVLTLANPARKNALDSGFFELLDAALADLRPRALLLRAAGEGLFSAGYDLQSLSAWEPSQRLPDERLGEVFDRLSQHPAPSVALVTGPAIGAGCELACACDFRVGDEGAAFVMPPAKLGVVYALKGLARLSSRTGEQHARFLLLTGRKAQGEEARRLGLLDVLAARGQAQAQAFALAEELAANAPLALSGIKQGLSLARELGGQAVDPPYEALRRASFASADAREGREAVLAKRPPRFQGK